MSKKKKGKKVKSRVDIILDGYDKSFLNMWYGDDELSKQKHADYVLELKNFDTSPYDLGERKVNNKWTKKYKKAKKKKNKSIKDEFLNSSDIIYYVKKEEEYEAKLHDTKDVSIATFLNSKKYKKKFLNKKNYSKKVKELIKLENESIKTAMKLGYVVRNDPDEELKKLKKATKDMQNALNDAYTQKHFL